MTAAQAAKILTDFNKWRRGDGKYTDVISPFDVSPKDIGIAIDVAIKKLKSK